MKELFILIVGYCLGVLTGAVNFLYRVIENFAVYGG